MSWQEHIEQMDGGVTVGAGGQDLGADSGRGSSISTGVAASTGCNFLGSGPSRYFAPDDEARGQDTVACTRRAPPESDKFRSVAQTLRG